LPQERKPLIIWRLPKARNADHQYLWNPAILKNSVSSSPSNGKPILMFVILISNLSIRLHILVSLREPATEERHLELRAFSLSFLSHSLLDLSGVAQRLHAVACRHWVNVYMMRDHLKNVMCDESSARSYSMYNVRVRCGRRVDYHFHRELSMPLRRLVLTRQCAKLRQ
jgi:hypothetical protein